MFNPFARYVDNPSPVDEKISSHEGLWSAMRKLRIRQAITDTRVLYNTWAIGLLVGLHIVMLGLVIALVAA